MRLCIVYCGGCNPKYDRKAMVNRLREEYSNIKISNYQDSEECDLVIVLSGCKSSCVEHDHIVGRFGKVIVEESKDYEKIVNAIENNNI